MADGTWVDTTDQEQIEAMVGHNVNTAVDIGVVTQNPNFLIKLWKAISWDFSFLQDDLQIIRWILLCLSAGATYAIGQEFRGTITSIFGRR